MKNIDRRLIAVGDFEVENLVVTNGLWWEVMGGEAPSPEEADLPKVHVSWIEGTKFMNARSERDGFEPVYSFGADGTVTESATADGYRYPSEEEWEYAARAGTTGERYGDVDEVAVYGRTEVAEIGTKKPNAWGFFDMLGLVWEWTGSVSDPAQEGRIVRGGSWTSVAASCTADCRSFDPPGWSFDCVGFRAARGKRG